MAYYLDWETDGADWPNRQASRFVEAAGLRWHVQVMGQGPALLLLHGTGASTHSWRGVMPKLAAHYTVIAPDLPGHAFSNPAAEAEPVASRHGRRRRHAAQGSWNSRRCVPWAIRRVPRSSSAWRWSGSSRPTDLISFNGAFFPVSGVAGQFFSPLAKAVAGASLLQKMFARMADRKAVERLLRDTGSVIDEEGITLYQRLFSNEGHVAGTLGMMAAWDLHWVPQDLRNLPVPLYAGARLEGPHHQAHRRGQGVELAPQGTVIEMQGLGHLAHEEDPASAAAIIAAPGQKDLR